MKQSEKQTKKYPKGFTLIELLVVVLIIGILAAIALPQYQKAVKKARYTREIVHSNILLRALQEYRLNTGEWPEDYANIPKLAELKTTSTFYVNRRNTSTETAVLITNGIALYITKGGEKITRFCRASSTSNSSIQTCKDLTGKSTGSVSGGFTLYQFEQ